MISFLISISLLCNSGRITTKSCYLWNELETVQMAEIDSNSLVIKLDENESMTHVFYLKQCKVGYIKNEYLIGLFSDLILTGR